VPRSCFPFVEVAGVRIGRAGTRTPRHSGRRPCRDTRPATPSHGQDQAASAPTSENVGLLRRAPQSADAVPNDLAQQPILLPDGPVSADNATKLVDLASARRVGTSDTWIAPGPNGTLCHFTYGTVRGCAPADQLRDDGVSPSVSWRAGEGITVAGITSDAVSSVVVHFDDGSQKTLPASDNYFEINTNKVPVDVSWDGPNGAERTSFPVELLRTVPRSMPTAARP
jgi:hypothetical protein